MRNIKGIIALCLLFSLVQCKPKTQQNTTATTTTTVDAAELSKADVTNITNREISSWEFAKTKQLDKLKELLADDYQAFFGKILMNKSEVLQSFQQSNITAYRLSNIRVKKVSNDVAIIYYQALQNATDPEGDRWVPEIGASTTYVKRGNVWYSVFYHETAVTR
jgi:hypothetical protein